MLRTRILTALVLAPLAFGLVFGLSENGFSAAMAAVLMVGCWEYRKLGSLDDRATGWLLLLLQLLLFLGLYSSFEQWFGHVRNLLLVACIAWPLMFMRMRGFRQGQGPDSRYRAGSFLSALAVLSFGWVALSWLRHEPGGSWWILTLLLLIWAADIGAYFSGRAFGKKKLAPELSPGKTRAGLYGGLIAASLTGAAAATWMPGIEAGVVPLALLAAVTALVSVGGDLFISFHKRVTGHKDSGRIFPGHGGVLDRLDSLMAGAPFFALGKLLAGF